MAPAAHIYISGRAYARVEASFVAEQLGTLDLKGFRRPVAAYDLIEPRVQQAPSSD